MTFLPKKDRDTTRQFWRMMVFLPWIIFITLLFLKWLIFILGGHPFLDISLSEMLSQVSAARKVEFKIRDLSYVLLVFREEQGRFPNTQEGLNSLYRKSKKDHQAFIIPYETSFKDLWGRELRYFCPGFHNQDFFDLFSVGKDGVEGTIDDINNWSENQPWKEHYKKLDSWFNLLDTCWYYLVMTSFWFGTFMYLLYEFWLMRLKP